ncbi:MAG: cupin [Armatimonadetes bacterium RBG_19FT_COMBO_69_19]|nr:MAG: cupin [Armatimonadetes bacterium RBG_19FT_COMBO_69_19]
MKHIKTAGTQTFFRIVAATARSQAATMVLKPGDTTGGEDNEHPESDQWLYVVSGSGQATVKARKVPIEAGSLLLIEAGEMHEIRNTGAEPLVTINVYAPPAY